ncbi:hypothetical protein D3C86_1824400 [compost metagenome]
MFNQTRLLDFSVLTEDYRHKLINEGLRKQTVCVERVENAREQSALFGGVVRGHRVHQDKASQALFLTER